MIWLKTTFSLIFLTSIFTKSKADRPKVFGSSSNPELIDVVIIGAGAAGGKKGCKMTDTLRYGIDNYSEVIYVSNMQYAHVHWIKYNFVSTSIHSLANILHPL